METYWEDSTLPAPVKYENHLSYNTANNSEDDEYGFHGSKKKLTRDPLSHRIIEKRRRDRMNSCLADLSRLIPHEYMKKGRGRVEKTEIIEMAIRRIKHLMSHAPCQAECRVEDMDTAVPPISESPVVPTVPAPASLNGSQCSSSIDTHADSYRLGFAECLNETVHFLVQVEGLMVEEPLCSRLRSHLTNHCDNILQSNHADESIRSRLCFPNGLGDEKPSLQSRSTPPPPTHPANSLPQEVPEHMDGRLHDLGYSNSNSALSSHQNHRPPQACGACAQHESSSDASTGGHTNNLSPTSWNSEKPLDDTVPPQSTYKFKHRIQKRFERTEMVSGADTRMMPSTVTPSTLVPIFALAPSGCHYYASWIEAGAIPSYLAYATDSNRNSRWLSAHSVTISVDFSLSRSGS